MNIYCQWNRCRFCLVSHGKAGSPGAFSRVLLMQGSFSNAASPVRHASPATPPGARRRVAVAWYGNARGQRCMNCPAATKKGRHKACLFRWGRVAGSNPLRGLGTQARRRRNRAKPGRIRPSHSFAPKRKQPPFTIIFYLC